MHVVTINAVYILYVENVSKTDKSPTFDIHIVYLLCELYLLQKNYTDAEKLIDVVKLSLVCCFQLNFYF